MTVDDEATNEQDPPDEQQQQQHHEKIDKFKESLHHQEQILLQEQLQKQNQRHPPSISLQQQHQEKVDKLQESLLHQEQILLEQQQQQQNKQQNKQQNQQQHNQQQQQHVHHYHHHHHHNNNNNSDKSNDGNDDDDDTTLNGDSGSSRKKSTTSRRTNGRYNTLWPPWPFNLLVSSSDSDSDTSSHHESSHQSPPDSSTVEKINPRTVVPYASTTTSPSSTASTSTTAAMVPSSSSSPLYRIITAGARFAMSNAVIVRKNIQDSLVQLWYHLPPAISPLLIAASIPYRKVVVVVSPPLLEGAVSETTTNTIIQYTIPIISNPFVRNLILSGIGLAILSWAHAELRSNHHHHQHYYRLSSTSQRQHLLLPRQYYRDTSYLPPFLPEYIPTPPISSYRPPVLLDEDEEDNDDDEIVPIDAKNNEEQTITDSSVPIDPSAKKLWKNRFPTQLPNIPYLPRNKDPSIGTSGDGTTTKRKTKATLFIPQRIRSFLSFSRWKDIRAIQARDRKNAYRQSIYNELVQRQQQLKRTRTEEETATTKSRYSSRYRSTSHKHGTNSTTLATTTDNPTKDEVGFALVTGASRGIGRALAVELARWGIPLILIARDEQALVDLANDIETCYGVPCYVVPADLSIPGIAEEIYETTNAANLRVDYLINNAGISTYQELSVDVPLPRITDMIQINTMTLTALTQLYGYAMKERRSGRILMISSVSGAVQGIASVAVYAATKAYENSYTAALSKELEPFGVTVTCCQPGAVRDTSFKSESHIDTSLCWKIPLYAKTPYYVAHASIRGMFRGAPEITPGIFNRIFIKVIRPIVPVRIYNLIAELFWSPFHLPFEQHHTTSSRLALIQQDHTTNQFQPQASIEQTQQEAQKEEPVSSSSASSTVGLDEIGSSPEENEKKESDTTLVSPSMNDVFTEQPSNTID